MTKKASHFQIDRIEKKIRNRFPDIKRILIEAESITALERNALARQPESQ